MIDLEDFSQYKQIHKDIQEQDLSKEEIEARYIEELERLKEEFNKKLEEETQKAYEEGYKEAVQEQENILQQVVQEHVNQVLQQKNSEIQEIYDEFSKMFKDLYNKVENRFSHLQDLLLDSISEILQFLYISPNNEDFIIKQIEKILLEYKKAINIEIKVHPEMKEKVQKVFQNIEVETDENLTKGDFIIEVSDLQIENKIKEKLEVMKNEIKREIQKLT